MIHNATGPQKKKEKKKKRPNYRWELKFGAQANFRSADLKIELSKTKKPSDEGEEKEKEEKL